MAEIGAEIGHWMTGSPEMELQVDTPDDVATSFVMTSRLAAAISALSSNDEQALLEAIEDLKCELVGSNRRRRTAIDKQVPAKLLSCVVSRFPSLAIRRAVVTTMTVFGLGPEECLDVLLGLGTYHFLLSEILTAPTDYAVDCIACLRMLYSSGRGLTDLLSDHRDVVTVMLGLLNHSTSTKHDVATILRNACISHDDHLVLLELETVDLMFPLLFCNVPRVLLAASNFFVALLCRCRPACEMFRFCRYSDTAAVDRLFQLLSPWNGYEVQLAASECLVYLTRADCLPEYRDCVKMKVIPSLIRILTLPAEWRDERLQIRACNALAYCVEVAPDLQYFAHWTNQCPQALGQLINTGLGRWSDASSWHRGVELLEAGLNTVAAMIGHREDVCRRVMSEITTLIPCLVSVVTADRPDQRPLLAALNCLLSMSRWVEQLRTTFFDNRIYKAVIALLTSNPPKDSKVIAAVTALLCNLLLEFSPCKDSLLNMNVLEHLTPLMDTENHSIRLNVIWALQNCAYRTDTRNRSLVLDAYPPARMLYAVTEMPPGSPIVIRLLYTLVNLLSNRIFVDIVMNVHGVQIMQIVVFILEGAYSNYEKEAALMIIAHIADGDCSKEALVNNEDILLKLANYMQHACLRLQIASVRCVCNLLWKEGSDPAERQDRLRDVGILKILQQLLSTTDKTLYNLAKLALQQV